MFTGGENVSVLYIATGQPTEVQIGVYIISFYSISEQTMVRIASIRSSVRQTSQKKYPWLKLQLKERKSITIKLMQ